MISWRDLLMCQRFYVSRQTMMSVFHYKSVWDYCSFGVVLSRGRAGRGFQVSGFKSKSIISPHGATLRIGTCGRNHARFVCHMLYQTNKFLNS